MLEEPELNLSTMLGRPYVFGKGIGLKDGEILTVAGFKLRVIHTPGHTSGGCCYYEADEAILLSGDTLFYRSVGRTDFPTGDAETLASSIKEKLFVLPDDVMVYPGHDSQTCIADEKQGNSFV